MHIISGGVTAPKGFQAAGIHCGIKDNFTTPQPEKKDLAMILSAVPCAAAGTFTRNVVKADPVRLTREHLADHKAQGIIFDSGNANACCPQGHGERPADGQGRRARPRALHPEDFAVCLHRRHRAGAQHRRHPRPGMPAAGGRPRRRAARPPTATRPSAIMTTDTVKVKEIALAVLDRRQDRDTRRHRQGLRHDPPQHGHHAVLRHHRLRHHPGAALRGRSARWSPRTFNRVTVDGDTSTNDMCAVLANGMAGNPLIDVEG